MQHMSVEAVRTYFEKWPGMEARILEFPVSSATVAEAALAVGTQEQRIAKTLSFLLERGPILVVAAGDAKVDNKKFKAAFHKKASMLKADELTELIGHPAGGVCPFAVREGRGDLPGRLAQEICYCLSRLRERQQRHRAVHPGAGDVLLPL